jgi:hypothetical protein
MPFYITLYFHIMSGNWLWVCPELTNSTWSYQCHTNFLMYLPASYLLPWQHLSLLHTIWSSCRWAMSATVGDWLHEHGWQGKKGWKSLLLHALHAERKGGSCSGKEVWWSTPMEATIELAIILVKARAFDCLTLLTRLGRYWRTSQDNTGALYGMNAH